MRSQREIQSERLTTPVNVNLRDSAIKTLPSVLNLDIRFTARVYEEGKHVWHSYHRPIEWAQVWQSYIDYRVGLLYSLWYDSHNIDYRVGPLYSLWYDCLTINYRLHGPTWIYSMYKHTLTADAMNLVTEGSRNPLCFKPRCGEWLLLTIQLTFLIWVTSQ